MVRSLSFAAAIAAMLVIPFTQADARHGGSMGGARMGSAHFSSGGRFSSGARISSFSTFRSSRVSVIGPRRVAFIGPRFRHHRFVGLYGVGLYGTCWRWVPTVYGVRRVWVCDPYYNYY